MPQNFGEVFAQNYAGGVKLEKEMQRHAEEVVLEEQKMEATRAIEVARMEQLNKQLEATTSYQNRMLQHQYESDAQQVRQQQLQTFESRWGRIDPKIAKAYGIKAIPIESQQDTYDRLPLKEQAGNWITDTESLNRLRYLQTAEYMARKEAAKETKDDQFLAQITALTKLANENARGYVKQETIPGEEPGAVNKYLSEQWNQSSLKILLDKFDKLNLFGSGSPAQTKYVTDESRLGPAIDKQVNIIQSMEASIMNKKVNPKLASMFLDPQKSALLQMVSGHIAKDDKGMPVLTNTQGMNPTTISKIQDILDEYRMQQLSEQAKSLSNEKTQLQVEQLEEKVR